MGNLPTRVVLAEGAIRTFHLRPRIPDIFHHEAIRERMTIDFHGGVSLHLARVETRVSEEVVHAFTLGTAPVILEASRDDGVGSPDGTLAELHHGEGVNA